MSFRTIMVHLDVGANNDNILSLAREVSGRFNANVIGIAASQPMVIAFADGFGSGDLIEQNRLEIEQEITAAEASFRKVFEGWSQGVEWRSEVSFQSSADFMADEMRTADLLITAPERGGDFLDTGRRVEIGDLVMRMGRPAIIAPPAISSLKLESALVGWKDTRETRRVLADALPLLKLSGRVTIAAIAPEADFGDVQSQVNDVVTWLEHHAIKAKMILLKSSGDDAEQLAGLVQDVGADLLVAGGYGHNRLREWMFGGVTRDLLLRPTSCTFVSH